jgi:hypothetical protein
VHKGSIVLWLVALVVISASACAGSTSPSSRSLRPSISCDGVPAQICDEEVLAALRSAGDRSISAIQVSCGVCEPSGARGETEVQFADGTRTVSSWAVGVAEPAPATTTPPPLTVEPRCEGVPRAQCLERATALISTMPDRQRIAGIVMSCDGTCDATNGRGEAIITFREGTSTSIGWAYATDH